MSREFKESKVIKSIERALAAFTRLHADYTTLFDANLAHAPEEACIPLFRRKLLQISVISESAA